MASDVDVPAVGRVDKKWVYAGVATVAGIVGFAWWKRRSATPSYVPPDPTTGTDSADPVYRNPAPQFTGGGDAGTLPPTTDPEWSQRVLETLNWLEPAYLGDILGKYVGGQGLTWEEAAVIRGAWAVVGRPPSNKPIIMRTDGGSTPGVPNTSMAPSAPSNLHITEVTASSVSLAWDPVPGAMDYTVVEHSDFGGSNPQYRATPETTWSGLMSGVEHVFYVRTRNSAGESGPAIIHAWTAK